MEQEFDTVVFREALEREFKQLTKDLPSLRGRAQSRSINPDSAELAQRYTAQERDAILRPLERERLDQIIDALKRLDAGNYGSCVSCGEAIALGRLRVLPYATLCINCQKKQEKIIW